MSKATLCEVGNIFQVLIKSWINFLYVCAFIPYFSATTLSLPPYHPSVWDEQMELMIRQDSTMCTCLRIHADNGVSSTRKSTSMKYALIPQIIFTYRVRRTFCRNLFFTFRRFLAKSQKNSRKKKFRKKYFHKK